LQPHGWLLRAFFEGAQHAFMQNKMNDNGGQKNNAEDNNEWWG
jgi:hypothetical protein